MPAFISHVVAAWAALYSGSAVLRTLVSFVHVAGLVGGGGAAIAADRATLKATRRGLAVTREQIDAIHHTHRVVILGLAARDRQRRAAVRRRCRDLRASKLFWLKMVMVAALMVNGAILVRVGHGVQMPDERTRRTMRWTAGLSLALWFLTTLVGAGLPNI